MAGNSFTKIPAQSRVGEKLFNLRFQEVNVLPRCMLVFNIVLISRVLIFSIVVYIINRIMVFKILLYFSFMCTISLLYIQLAMYIYI